MMINKCKFIIVSMFLLVTMSSLSAQPRFYHGFDSLNDDVYNKKFVYAAAESCGVDTNVDLITVWQTRGYSFIKVLPWKGHYRILQTRRIDAQWEKDKLVMYECFDPDYDTVFVVDTLPEASPKVVGIRREQNALRIYKLCRAYTIKNHPDHHMWKIEKTGLNFYKLVIGFDYQGWDIEFKEIGDTMCVVRTGNWIN